MDDSLSDPTPTADALAPQLRQLQSTLSTLIPSSSSSSSSSSKQLPSYEDLIAAIEGSTSQDAGANPLAGRLEAARMNASLAYLLLDSLWILMKTKGINLSSTHPLHAELERARLYVAKVKQTSTLSGGDEKQGSAGGRERDAVLAAQQGPQRRIDAGPAARFVKAALANQPKGKLTKFADDDNNAGGGDHAATTSSPPSPSNKLGKRKSPQHDASSPIGQLPEDPRRKKRIMDPYTEYDNDEIAGDVSAVSLASRGGGEGGDEDGEDMDDDDGDDQESGTQDSRKKDKRKKKKKKKKGGKGSK
ncbi:hypothetical protein V8E36_007107 [Tilletia maclaganii]